MGGDRLLEFGTEVYGRCQRWVARRAANVRGIAVRFSLPSVGASVRSKLRSAILLCPGLVENGDGLPPIPLTLDRRSLCVRYRCAIAQRLAARLGRSPVQIATEIATAWQSHPDLDGRSLAALTVRSDGSLDLELTDQAIAVWLDGILALGEGCSVFPEGAIAAAGGVSLGVYQAFVRSQACVVAAEREGWFDRGALAPLWCDQAGCLRLGLAAEWRAIVGLVGVIDGLSLGGQGLGAISKAGQRSDQPNQLVRLADRLAADFEWLDRHSRPWQAYHTQDRAMAIVRVGLFQAYARVLHTVLGLKDINGSDSSIPREHQTAHVTSPLPATHLPDAKTSSPDQNHNQTALTPGALPPSQFPPRSFPY